MALAAVSLDDKYDLAKRRVLVTGTQAVVRLLLMQQARDRRLGQATAGYVTGYRGSPLGGLDQQFWRAADVLQPADIVFQPGINEDLAATALWGTQQAELRGEGRFDGVFGIWYGKGPGVDRSGDALRHANLAGTSPLGGVLALMGDDHTCESSTTAHQSEYAFVDAMIPVLSPAGVQEILDYGLFGYALSRYAGTWVGLKCVKDTVEFDGHGRRVARPGGDDRSRRLPHAARRAQHPPARQSAGAGRAAARVQDPGGAGLPAGQRARPPRSFRRTRSRGSASSPRARAISTSCQALDDLGIDEVRAANLGLRLLKVACTWPLEPQAIRDFAERPRDDRRGRGEARPDREPDQGDPLRHRQPAGGRRQEGRGGRVAVPLQGRARHQQHRHRHRRAARRRASGRAARPAPRRRSAMRRRCSPACAMSPSARPISAPAAPTTPPRSCRRARAPMPASAATTWSSACRPAYRGLHPDGRRRRQLDRRGAVLHPRPRLPEYRRRHL